MPSTNPRNYDATPSRKLAFLGLGVMGYPMAGHLALAGHGVTVYNRTATKSIAWCAEYNSTKAPKHAATPREAAAGADIGGRGARDRRARLRRPVDGLRRGAGGPVRLLTPP